MINKNTAIKLMNNFGDFIIDFNNGRQPIAATLDFKNKYIRRVKRTKRFVLKGKILLFNWTDYDFEAISTDIIKNITPLSSILENKEFNNG